MQNDGFFFVIEGLDGSGKTEVARRVAHVLRQTHGDDVTLTFEPHDPSCAGLFIRQVLNRSIASVPLRTLALAFAANRADHCDRVVNPFLRANPRRIVVCDRYYLSSLVYQTSDDLSLQEVMLLNSHARRPDLTIFLNASTKTCYERMRRRPEDKELFETNLRWTREKYQDGMKFLANRGELIVEADADGPIADVVDKILDLLASGDGPRWLVIQRPLAQDILPEVFSLNGDWNLTIPDLAAEFSSNLDLELPCSRDDLLEGLSAIRHQLDARLGRMSFNDLGALFISYVRRLGYDVVGKLPWSYLDAFELALKLPLDVALRGTALLLGETQRYDVLMKKALDTEKLSDFMLVFDPRAPSSIAYYERSIVRFPSGGEGLAPSTRILTRDDLSKAVLGEVVSHLKLQQPDVGCRDELVHVLPDVIDVFQLEGYVSKGAI